MPRTVTIQLERPIESAELASQASATMSRQAPMNNGSVGTGPSCPGGASAAQAGEQNQNLMQICQALDAAAGQLKHLQENIIKEHKEQIAKLAVEIARKVLTQQIKEGDYKIEAIIQEALDNIPTLRDVVVHLNPEDFAQCQMSESENEEIFKNVKLVSDPNVGKAECLVETPKGVIESVIEEHLENISKALTNME
jgi:flagellar assembly protein FliH